MTPASSSHSHQLEQESLLQRIINRIRQSLELQEILNAAVVEVRTLLQTDRVKIYRFYPDGHGEVIAESIFEARLPSLLGLHFPADDVSAETREAFVEVRQRVIVNVETQQIRLDSFNSPDAETGQEHEDRRYRAVEPCHIEYLKAMGVASSLVIPILPQNSLWGLLVSHHSQPLDLSEDALQVAQLVADQVSIAIAQASLLADARSKAQQEATINQITAHLHHLPTINLATGLQHVVQALNGSGGRLHRLKTAENPGMLYCYGAQPTLRPTFKETAIEQHILWQEYFRPYPKDATTLSSNSAAISPPRPRTANGKDPSTSIAYTLSNVYAEPRLRVLAPCFRSTAIRGLLVVPLQYRQTFLGYLSIFRDAVDQEMVWAGQWDTDQRQVQPRNSFVAWREEKRGQPVTWTDEDVKLAEALAIQFAIAIHEYELYQQAQAENHYRQQVETTLRRQAEEERLRVAILQRIHQTLNLYTILDITVAEVRRFLQTDRVLIYRFDPHWTGTIVAESVSSHDLSLLGQMIYDPCFAEKEQYKPYQQGHISQITNIHELDLMPCYFDMLHGFQIQANLVVPILMNNWQEESSEMPASPQEPTLWGLLLAHNCTAPRQWQPWEVNFLQQLAVQVAIALNQAELYQQVHLLNADLEQQVQQRTQELQQSLKYESLLKRITDKVRDSLDEDQILQSAVAELANGLQVACCDCALYDLEKRISTIRYEHLQVELTPAIGLCAEMNHRPNLYDLLLKGQHVQFCTLPGTTIVIRSLEHQYTVFACPLMDDQGVLGDLWLLKPSHQYFDELDTRLVQQVANQCAIALRQAQLYQASQAQVEELARLNQLKDDFLSTVSHELRTPMSSIKLATQMLEMILMETGVLEVEDNKATQYFQILNSECKREINLINDLLDLTRLDAGSEPLSLTTINFSIWIPHVVEAFTARAASQQQQIEVTIAPNLPAITTDLSYVERVLSELLHNACKYTPAQGKIHVACDWVDAVFHLRVSNTGVEIADSERDRIFDKFYRIPNSDPWRHGGTGLGLALVKKLTEFLNGSIHVETQPNQTSFVVELPSLEEGGSGE